MKIRRAVSGEEQKVHDLVRLTCEASWPSIYPQASIDYVINDLLTPALIKNRIENCNFYVIEENDKIIGCGGIDVKDEEQTEARIRIFFINPTFQGKGLGRKLVETLESDEILKDVKRIEAPASMFAIPFYKKMGYEHKGGKLNYRDGDFIMEKFLKR